MNAFEYTVSLGVQSNTTRFSVPPMARKKSDEWQS